MHERIKLLRKQLGLTQQEFADKLNIKRGAIANYEIGRNIPIDAVVTLICRQFNVNEDWLRNGTGDMFRILPEEDELSIFVEELLAGTDDTIYRAIRAFLLTYGKMNAASKRVMNELIDNWLEEMKKEQD